MAWEKRQRGGHYYTRSKRVGGRVVREYVGTGRIGELAAAADARERAKRAAEAEAWRTERVEMAATDELVREFDALVSLLTRGTLIAAGYHRHHRGEWRRRRG